MNNKILSIQALRGLAALLVVIYHTQSLMITYTERHGISQAIINSTEKLSSFGAIGVDIFFVISGFVMAFVTFNHFGNAQYVKLFVYRRLVRIAPIYWIYTTVIAALLFFMPQLFSRASFDLTGTFLSYIFIPYTPIGENHAPILSVGWTLWYEMYFYCLVALGLFLPRAKFFLYLGIYFFLSIGLGFFIEKSAIMHVVTNPILLEFFVGFALGLCYKKNINITKNTSICLLLLSCILTLFWLLHPEFAYGKIFFAIIAISCVGGAVFYEKNKNITISNLFLRLGDSSYSLYLSHFIALPALGKILFQWEVVKGIHTDILIALLVTICCIIGYVSYILCERPIALLLKSK